MSKFMTMKVCVFVLFVEITIVSASARAADSWDLEEDIPIDRALLKYRQRCIIEIGAHMSRLDNLNKKLGTEFSGTTNQSTFERALLAWSKGTEARTYFNALLDVVAKYNAWSKAAECPEWFNVPEEVVKDALDGRRWEFLRPLLLPGVHQHTLLGWDNPENDVWPWHSVEARLYEWFVLLKWLVDPPTDIDSFDRAWVWTEVGGSYLNIWRGGTQKIRRFFHGQYEYRPLAPPDLDGSPFRVREIAQRMCWRADGKNNLHQDLHIFVKHKREVLWDVLRLLMDRGNIDPVVANWFICGARTFPFFTALTPEVGVDSVKVVSVEDTERHRLIDAVKRVTTGSAHLDTRRDIHDAIYWYQLTMYPDGRWSAPLRGWSTLIPDQSGQHSAQQEPQLDDVIDQRNRFVERSGSEERSTLPANPKGALRPHEAWRSICHWVGQTILTYGDLQPGHGLEVHVVFHKRGWRFAFGDKELAEVLEGDLAVPTWTRPWNGDDANVVDVKKCEVRIEDVMAHEFVTLGVWLDNKRLAEKRFAVPGDWPEAFAARIIPHQWHGILVVALIGLIVYVWRARSVLHESNRFDKLAIVTTFALIVVTILFLPKPVPVQTDPIGAPLDVIVAADAATPDGLRDAIVEFCTGLFGGLIGDGSDDLSTQALADTSWLSRYLKSFCALCRPVFIPRGFSMERAPRRRGFSHGTYRLRSSAWRDEKVVGGGPLCESQISRFRTLLEKLPYEGEATVPGTFSWNDTQDFALEFVVWHGDHGEVARPQTLTEKPNAPRICILPLDPVRDGNGDRGLYTRHRVVWIQRRSSLTFYMRPDGTVTEVERLLVVSPEFIEKTDHSGQSPQDMEALRRSCWVTEELDVEKLRKAGHDVAKVGLNFLKEESVMASRTTLGLRYESWRGWLLVVMWIMFAALPLWLRRRGISDLFHLQVTLVRFLFMACLLVCILPLLAEFENNLRSYWGTPMVGLRFALWWCVGAQGISILSALTFWILTIKWTQTAYSRRVIGTTRTFSSFRDTLAQRLWSIKHVVSQSIGLILLATAYGWLATLPVREFPSRSLAAAWLPNCYGLSVALGCSLMCYAGYFLWHAPFPQNGIRLNEKPVVQSAQALYRGKRKLTFNSNERTTGTRQDTDSRWRIMQANPKET